MVIFKTILSLLCLAPITIAQTPVLDGYSCDSKNEFFSHTTNTWISDVCCSNPTLRYCCWAYSDKDDHNNFGKIKCPLKGLGCPEGTHGDPAYRGNQCTHFKQDQSINWPGN